MIFSFIPDLEKSGILFITPGGCTAASNGTDFARKPD
jgi:hypothetical protein